MDVQRRDSQANFNYFSPLLFVFASLGGALRQPNSSVANVSCTCKCVKEPKSKKKQALIKWDENTTNDNSLMQVLLARFGSFGIETTVYHGPHLPPLHVTFPLSQLPQSQIQLLLSSSSVPGRADKASVSLGSWPSCMVSALSSRRK